MREDVDVASLEILNKILTDNFSAGSEGQKIQALYGTFMNWDKRNADGIAPIKADLAKIDQLKTIADLQKYLIEATKTGDNPLYAWRVGADLKKHVNRPFKLFLSHRPNPIFVSHQFTFWEMPEN